MPGQRHNGDPPDDGCDLDPLSGPSGHNGDPPLRRCDAAQALAARFAEAQHGLATRWDLLGAGVSRKVIDRGVRRWLHPIHDGVYAVGHTALAREARLLAAVLACGPGAVLAGESAAVSWGLLPWRDGTIHVLRTGARRRSPAGIVLHHTTALARADVRVRDRIPVTAPERTLLDLAATGSPGDLRAALREARIRRLVMPEALLARAAGRPGARHLRAALGDEPHRTRSEAERELLRLLRRAEIPAPETNVRVGRYEVDALWRAERLAVEVDGYRFHGSREAFERDRLRDAHLQSAGLRVLRITWNQLTKRPEATAARIATLLTAGPSNPPPPPPAEVRP